MAGSQAAGQELDVRPLAKADKHPTISAAYNSLAVREWFVLVNDHDPKHLRAEFEADHPGGYGWEYLKREPRDWQVRITKLASTPLPRLLADTAALPAGADAAGAVWTLQARERDLDSNIIALPPERTIEAHDGPDLDVLIHVVSGTGTLTTEMGVVDRAPGALVWLPRRSRRRFDAGPDGLRYLTVHRRRQALVLETGRRGADR